MIHACFCFCDKTGHYAKFAGTAMLSLFENTCSEVTVHILHDNTLTADNHDKFAYLAGRYEQFVNFYNLDELCPDTIAEIIKLVPEAETAKVTVGAFYKLLIPKVLPKDIEKVVFLDPDTIINLDINELWQMELADKALGVVPGTENGTDCKKNFPLCSEGIVQGEDYFNTGVLLMNLNVLRGEEETIMQGIKFRGENPKHKFFEQTVLNYCFSARTVKLPSTFNLFVKNVRKNSEATLERKIYHYVDGSSRPGLDMTDVANRLWMYYFIKTPWFDAETFGRLYAKLRTIRNELKDSALEISTIISGKSRAFFVEPKKADSIKNFFLVSNQEQIIPAENEGSIKKLIDAMKKNKGKTVFFIMTEKFPKKAFPFSKLTNAGFEEGKDFLRGWLFLPDPQNVPAASYPYIEEL